MTHSPVIDPGLCPLCGQPNGCAMVCAPQLNGLDLSEVASPPTQNEPCWCTRVQFSERLLQQVPAAAKNKACICLRCATSADALGKD
jgi:hypothetical protein